MRQGGRLAWLAFAMLLWISGAAYSQVLRFLPVAPQIYAAVGDTNARTPPNAGLNANYGLIVTAQGAILLDSGASVHSAKLIEQAVKAVTSQPVKWVINTGSQDHRWLGNAYFAAQGAQIWAHEAAVADMSARGAEQLASLKQALQEQMAGTTAMPAPNLIRGQHQKLQWGGMDLEFVYRGGGHTPGDMLVWLPRERVVFAGDVVYVDRMLGMLPVSRSKTWLESFEALDTLAPAIVVPGHGNVTQLATARQQTRDLLGALRAHMKKEVDGAGDLNAAVRSFDGSPWKSLQHAQTWLGPNAHAVYLEVERE